MNIKKFIETKTVIHCKTEATAKSVYSELVKANYYWEHFPKNDSRWDVHGAETVYFLDGDELRYGYIGQVDTKKYKVVVA